MTNPTDRPTEAAFGRELASRPLRQPSAAVPRLLVAERREEKFAELPALPQLMHTARGHAEHPPDDADRADGWQDISELERAIRNVETARTRLRLATLVLRDLLHAARPSD